MYPILHKQQLSPSVFQMRIRAPLIAEERRAGQFIILQVDEEYGERIPLTIADASAEEGSITLIFQVVGKTTTRLSHMEAGDSLPVLVGPLGRPTHVESFGRVICLGGGIGVAPLHPIVEALRKAGNHVTTVIGARNRELVLLEDRMRALSDRLIVVTDDGSRGRKGLITEPLKELCEADDKPDLAIAIGPPIMMKFCAETTRPFGVHTLVSLNTIMVDGTGMCGGCRVNLTDGIKFVCVDGPEFDGHKVDWSNMMARLASYKKQERQSHDCYMESRAKEKEAGMAVKEARR